MMQPVGSAWSDAVAQANWTSRVPVLLGRYHQISPIVMVTTYPVGPFMTVIVTNGQPFTSLTLSPVSASSKGGGRRTPPQALVPQSPRNRRGSFPTSE
jgi:hypothetical protein